MGVPDTLVSKVNAKVKFAWNHTDYTVLNPNKKRDLKVYAHVDYIVSVSEPCRESFLKVYPDLTDKAITIENTLSETLLRKQAAEPVGDMKRVKMKFISYLSAAFQMQRTLIMCLRFVDCFVNRDSMLNGLLLDTVAMKI